LMSTEKMMVNTVDPDGKWLYRVGGISALVIGIGYIITIPLYAYVGVMPSGGEAALTYLAGKTTVWWAILGLMVLTDLLHIPVVLSLYIALKQVNRNGMLLGAAFVGLFVVLDLAILWTNHASLFTLSGLHAAATDEIQRASYVAAANYASAVLASPTIVLYSIVNPSLGILMIGFVMLKGKGIFNKVTAYFGLAIGISGIAAIAGIFVITMLNAVLATVWVFFVGFRLYRLGKQ
jgi:hypothetical protein